MKLAEALAERSDCQNRIEEIKKRLIRSARVQEGEQPAEDRRSFLRRPNASSRVFWNSSAQSTAPTRRLRSKTSVLFLMQLPNVAWPASVAISSQESQTPQAPGRIVTRSRRCDSLRPCRSESCRWKWISSQSGIANWIHGCRNSTGKPN
jgi:hypothetical protein